MTRQRPARLLTQITAVVLASAFASSERLHGQTTAAVEYSVAHFDVDLDAWHVLSLEALHRGGRGTVLGRGNLARRFGQTGRQAELELYPKLGASTYLYLAAGYSRSDIFPEARYGAELFHVVAPGLEASAGVRYLDFDARTVTLYTGSLAWYPRHFYVAVRPYVSRSDSKLLVSGNLHVRRYLGDEHQWIALAAGGGQVPGEGVTAFELERLGSASALLMGRIRATTRLGLRWSAGYEWEQLSGAANRNRVTAGVGVERRF